MSRFPLLVEFALATLTIALNGRNNIFAALKYWNCAVNLTKLGDYGELRLHFGFGLPLWPLRLSLK